MATRQLLSSLASQFQQASGHAVEIESVGGVDAAKRVQAGEVFDVVILAADAIDRLTAAGRVREGSRVDLVKSGVAVAVRAGAAQPAIATEEDVKQAVLAATTLSYSTGPSGVQLARLFERWGIDAAIQDRIVQAPPGVPVGSLVAKGEVELGFQQLSELLNVQGIAIVGPLPPEIQIVTRFSAGITPEASQPEAVRAWLDFLVSPQAVQTKLDNGMEQA